MSFYEPAHLEADGYLVRALRRLGEGLGPYVYGKTGSDDLVRDGSVTLDVQPILRVMVSPDIWDRYFRELGRDARGLANELIVFRNGPWAHLAGYSDNDVLHYLGVIERLLRAISADDQAQAVAGMWGELGRLIFRQTEPDKQLGTQNAELTQRIFELEVENSELLHQYSHVRGQLEGFQYAASVMSLPSSGTSGTAPNIVAATVDGTASGAQETAPSSAVDLWMAGTEAYEAGEIDIAVARYREALAVDPKDWRAHLLLGIACALSEEYEEAIANYNSALQIDSNLADAYVLRAMAYQEMSEHQLAIADFDAGLRLSPEEVEGYLNRGVSLAEAGEYDRAIADFDTVLSLDPDHQFAYNNRGNAYGALGNYDRAIADHTEAIRIAPDYSSAYYNRGFAHGANGEYEDAIRNFGKVLMLRPDDAAAYNHRGIAYGNLKMYDLAIADHNEAIRLDPGYGAAYYGRGLAHGAKGEYDQAIADFEEALRLNPSDAISFYYRGVAYAAMETMAELRLT